LPYDVPVILAISQILVYGRNILPEGVDVIDAVIRVPLILVVHFIIAGLAKEANVEVKEKDIYRLPAGD
jgi:hypothetical protein